MRLSTLLVFFCINVTSVWSSEIYVSEDLARSLESLYNYNPKIRYEREVLRSTDELMPQAFANFRPQISG